MASSTAALQEILSSSDDATNEESEELESEADEDYEIVESTGSTCHHVPATTSSLSTAAVSLLSTTTASLLTVLKAPIRQSDLARKRKVAVNPPPKGKHSSKSVNSKATICIKPYQHVKEFPNKHFTVLYQMESYFVKHEGNN